MTESKKGDENLQERPVNQKNFEEARESVLFRLDNIKKAFLNEGMTKRVGGLIEEFINRGLSSQANQLMLRDAIGTNVNSKEKADNALKMIANKDRSGLIILIKEILDNADLRNS